MTSRPSSVLDTPFWQHLVGIDYEAFFFNRAHTHGGETYSNSFVIHFEQDGDGLFSNFVRFGLETIDQALDVHLRSVFTSTAKVKNALRHFNTLVPAFHTRSILSSSSLREYVQLLASNRADALDAAVIVHLTTAQDQTIRRAPTKRLQAYLRKVSEQNEIAPETATLAWQAWNQLRAATSYSLPVPDACPGPDGQLLYTWDTEEHHFELEIFPDGRGETFYRNWITGELWGEDYAIGQRVPLGVFEKLAFFYN